MKKLIILAFIMLSACIEGIEESSDPTSLMNKICLDNVEYWFRAAGQTAVMSPRIDPKTMTFVRCEEK